MQSSFDQPLINGYNWNWGAIQIFISGTPIFGITAINYEETQEIVNEYGAGRRPIARGLGNIEASGSVTLHTQAVKALEEAARNQGIPNNDLKGLQPFDIIVSYVPSEGQGSPNTDVLKNCQFTSDTRDMSQGDTSFELSLDLAISHIKWNQA